jgi:hypothetical protein
MGDWKLRFLSRSQVVWENGSIVCPRGILQKSVDMQKACPEFVEGTPAHPTTQTPFTATSNTGWRAGVSGDPGVCRKHRFLA